MDLIKNIYRNQIRERSNYYIRENKLDKFRGSQMDSVRFDYFDNKFQNKKELNIHDFEYLKTLDKVVIESDYGVELYNFKEEIKLDEKWFEGGGQHE